MPGLTLAGLTLDCTDPALHTNESGLATETKSAQAKLLTLAAETKFV